MSSNSRKRRDIVANRDDISDYGKSKSAIKRARNRIMPEGQLCFLKCDSTMLFINLQLLGRLHALNWKILCVIEH